MKKGQIVRLVVLDECSGEHRSNVFDDENIVGSLRAKMKITKVRENKY